jgi:hypothetical protein
VPLNDGADVSFVVMVAADRFDAYRKEFDKLIDSYAIKTTAPKAKDRP